jgi:hypothetical protein
MNFGKHIFQHQDELLSYRNFIVGHMSTQSKADRFSDGKKNHTFP